MAASDGGSSGASQLPKSEAATTGGTTATKITISKKVSRRQLTLIGLTVCLNVLLWSSIFSFIASIYLIAADPNDSTNIPSEILTITSALASIGYIITHTIFSLKQRIWKYSGQHPSIHQKTSYVAVRFAVTLCILWLLTCGWNMITVARRPVCLPDAPGLPGWEAGTTCVVGRASVAMSVIALIVSCTLFGMLAVLRRPFEAHVFKHGYRDHLNPRPTPNPSRRQSPSRSRSVSASPNKDRGRRSVSTHRTSNSNASNSNTDVETLDLNTSPPPSTILAPSPIRKIGLGIFASQGQPPQIPSAYHASRSISLDATPAFVQPTASARHLPPPPRMSALVTSSGFVPLSVPVQYSHSAWRAVHPNLPSPLGRGVPTASRSVSNLHHAASTQSFSYRSRYSRSSVSLTRPHRLSTATPVGSVEWSSRSGSTGPGDEGRGSPASGHGSIKRHASASEIAYAILNGTPIPGTAPPAAHKYQAGHIRRASAPDATCGATQQPTTARLPKGWKPQLPDPDALGAQNKAKIPIRNIVRSSSAELLSRFSPDSSPDDNTKNLRRELEKELDKRLSIGKAAPVRKTRSESPLRREREEKVGNGEKVVTSLMKEFRKSITSRIMQDPKVVKHHDDERRQGQETFGRDSMDTGAGAPDLVVKKRRMTIDEAKNKPLPTIAAL